MAARLFAYYPPGARLFGKFSAELLEPGPFCGWIVCGCRMHAARPVMEPPDQQPQLLVRQRGSVVLRVLVELGQRLAASAFQNASSRPSLASCREALR